MMNGHLLIGFILFASALIHGLVGFAFATTALPLLALIKGVKFSVPLLSLLSLLVNLATFVMLKNKDMSKLPLSFIFAILAGVVVGVYGFKIASEPTLKIILFFAILSYFIWEMFKALFKRGESYLEEVKPQVFKSFKSLTVAFIVGFLGGILYTPGPPIVIYLSILRVKKEVFMATLQVVFMITAFFAIINHILQGNVTQETFSSFMISLPIVLLGIYLGQRLYIRVSTKVFYYLVNIILFISAVLLLLEIY